MTYYGVPREIRDLEFRVGLTPAGVLALAKAGHTVFVESGAGTGAGFSDDDYRSSGGLIVYSASEVYGRSDIVVKVTRPTATEHALFRPDQVLFAFIHLPVASADLSQAFRERNITAVAYEMIELEDGSRPVLLPASEIAGRMAPLIAGQWLRSDASTTNGNGLGILLSGLPGVPAAVVVILGAGVLGANATRAFVGIGAEVTVLDHDMDKLRQLETRYSGRITTMFATAFNLERAVQFSDVFIGAVAIPGEQAPKLVSRDLVRQMRPGSVVIDFAIDQGGCLTTSRPTTLRDPIYIDEGVVHYCVPNVTAAYARTTSHAITNAAIPYLMAVGSNGLPKAAKIIPGLARGTTWPQETADQAINGVNP